MKKRIQLYFIVLFLLLAWLSVDLAWNKVDFYKVKKFFFADVSLPTTQYNYFQDFETTDPFVYWTSDGTYTQNFKDITDEQSATGTKSFKLDVTFGTASYVYYEIPSINQAIQKGGNLSWSGKIYIKNISGHGASAALGAAFNIVSVENGDVFNADRIFKNTDSWINQSGNSDTDFQNRIKYRLVSDFAQATPDDFGGQLDNFGLYLWGDPGSHFVVYVDDVNISGNVPDLTSYVKDRTDAFAAYQARVMPVLAKDAADVAAVQVDPSWNLIKKIKNDVAADYANALNRGYSGFAKGYPSVDEYNTITNALPLINSFVSAMPSSGFILFPWSSPTGKDRVYPYGMQLSPGEVLPTGNTLSIKAAKGEIDALSFVIATKDALSSVSVNASDLLSSGGDKIPASALDISLVKSWYRMNDQTAMRGTSTVLVPELLLKDDSLVRVDDNTNKNYLKVTQGGTQKYIDSITDPLPSDVVLQDASTLQPFNMDASSLKQVWITAYIPKNSPAGDYSGTITVTPNGVSPKTINVKITVLPFDLAPSPFINSIYYTGQLNPPSTISYEDKTETQLTANLKDLLDHGVNYPTIYQGISKLGQVLDIMKSLGFPTDHLFWIGDASGNPQDQAGLDYLKSRVTNFVSTATAHGFQDPYIYGMDEQSGDVLLSEQQAWTAVRQAGAKNFVAGTTNDSMINYLDAYVYEAGDFSSDKARMWHNAGNKIFTYGYSGVQSADLYRRNFGLTTYLNGFDGSMNWAYESDTCHNANIWNNFESCGYGGLSMVYPTSNGIVDTIPWEGFREGVTDVRYLATLINLDKTRTKSQIFSWAQNVLSSNSDLDAFRQTVINEISRIYNANSSSSSLSSSSSSSSSANPVCGDNICNGSETCTSCVSDCGRCPVCGDGVCSGTETCSSCPTDCKVCAKAPDAITDLKVVNQGAGSVVLSWTAVKTNDSYAKSYKYDIRYFSQPITSTNFQICTQPLAIPQPSSPGTAESFMISGLSQGKYYFAVETTNNSNQTSSISNVVTIDIVQSPTTSQAAVVFTKKLYLGVRDSQVAQLQTALAKDPQVYPKGKVSGYYGALTVQAVGAFQIKYGILPNASALGYGIVGPKTRDKLNQLYASVLPQNTPTSTSTTTSSNASTSTTPVKKVINANCESVWSCAKKGSCINSKQSMYCVDSKGCAFPKTISVSCK